MAITNYDKTLVPVQTLLNVDYSEGEYVTSQRFNEIVNTLAISGRENNNIMQSLHEILVGALDGSGKMTLPGTASNIENAFTDIDLRITAGLTGGKAGTRYFNTRAELNTSPTAGLMEGNVAFVKVDETNTNRNTKYVWHSVNGWEKAYDFNQAIGNADDTRAGLLSSQEYTYIGENRLRSLQNETDIAQEIIDRASADAGLQNQITTDVGNLATELVDRANADSALQTQIDAINTLLASDELTLDTLQEIVDYVQANRGDLIAHQNRTDNPHSMDAVKTPYNGTLRNYTNASTTVQAALDALDTQLKITTDDENLNTANRHNHTNKAILDAIEQAFTTALKNKLDNIEANANDYQHPANHPASMITEDATHRFATDAEKTAWNHSHPYLADTEDVETLGGRTWAQITAEINTMGSARALAVHSHVEADITDLDKYTTEEVDTFLGGKSDLNHTHLEADITNLDKYTKAEVDAKITTVNSGIYRKANVATEALLTVTYPTAQEGWTVYVEDTNMTYTFIDGQWDISGYGVNDIPVATQSQQGTMSASDKTKLDNIEAGANLYNHPVNHPATMITEDTDHKFVSQAQIDAWNALPLASHNHDADYKDINYIPTWAEITGKPATFTPSAHTHLEAEITNLDKYTQAEVNTLLAGKSDNHTHPYASDTHNHDADYSNISHNHAGVYEPVHSHPYLPLDGSGTMSGDINISNNQIRFAHTIDDMGIYADDENIVLNTFALPNPGQVKISPWTFSYNNYDIYHEGHKPTPSEIGADTSAEVDAKISALVDSAPGTLNTLNELAAALGDDPNFATTMTDELANKADIHSHPYLSNTLTIGNGAGYSLASGHNHPYRADTWLPTPAEIGARPDNWLPTPADIDAKNDIATGSTADPNNPTVGLMLTNHVNNPSGGGSYWYITTNWYSSKTGNCSQIAQIYNPDTKGLAIRHRYSGTWEPWQKISVGGNEKYTQNFPSSWIANGDHYYSNITITGMDLLVGDKFNVYDNSITKANADLVASAGIFSAERVSSTQIRIRCAKNVNLSSLTFSVDVTKGG